MPYGSDPVFDPSTPGQPTQFPGLIPAQPATPVPPTPAPNSPAGTPGLPPWDSVKATIEARESGGQNVRNYKYDPTHTAGGFWQLTDTNWKAYGPKVGVDLSQYPDALSAPKDVQEKVAKQLYQEQGLKPWAQSMGGGGYGSDKVVSAPGWNVSPNALAYEQNRQDTEVRYMTPDEYLAMTPEMAPGKSAKSRSLAKSLAAGDSIEAIPTLDVKTAGGKATVFDQDGRNRAVAAKDAGVDLIPVAIHGISADSDIKQIQGMRGEARPFDFKPVPAAHVDVKPRSTLAGIGQGLLDPVYGAEQLAQHLVPQSVENVASAIERPLDRLADALGLPSAGAGNQPADMDKVIAQREAQIAASRGPNAGFDFPRAGGQVLGGVALAAAAPEIFGGDTLASLAAGGAAQGSLEPVTGGNFGQQKLLQAGAGALAAPATALAGRAIAQAIGPEFRAAVDKLLGEGIRMTPGQMTGGAARRAENAMASVPGIGMAIRSGLRRSIEDFNRAAWNRVLTPLGMKLPTGIAMGRDAAQAVHAAIQNAYDRIIPNLTGHADQKFLNDLGRIGTRAHGDLPDAQWSTFRRILNAQLVQKQSAPANGEALKGIDTELGREAAGYKSDPSFDNRKLGQYLDEIHQAFRDTLERQNPQYRAPLKAANEAYANFVRVSRAAAALGAKDGIFTPAQLGNAVRASDTSLRKGAHARGTALLQDLSDAAQNVLPAVVPDSGTPERLAIGALAAGGAGYLEPTTLAASLAGSVPYTAPGMSLLRQWATAFPQVRRMIASAPRQGAALLAPGAAVPVGFAAGGG